MSMQNSGAFCVRSFEACMRSISANKQILLSCCIWRKIVQGVRCNEDRTIKMFVGDRMKCLQCRNNNRDWLLRYN